MKRVLTVITVLAASVLMNGCSKCSQERPAEQPPAAVEAPPAEMAPADAAPVEAAPAEEMAPGDASSAPVGQ